jgi:hypothetical protein
MAWSRRLAHEVVTLDGKRLRTLADARSYMLAIKDGREHREYWQHAARLLIEAAKGGGEKAVTDQLLIALLHDGTLDVTRTVTR